LRQLSHFLLNVVTGAKVKTEILYFKTCQAARRRSNWSRSVGRQH